MVVLLRLILSVFEYVGYGSTFVLRLIRPLDQNRLRGICIHGYWPQQNQSKKKSLTLIQNKQVSAYDSKADIDKCLRQNQLIISVKMQFKKNFSSNLKNLSIKKTLILQPPPLNHYSLDSEIQSARQSNSPYHRHRQCSSALTEFSQSNKENYTFFNHQQSNDNLCLSTSRRNSIEEKQNMNPLLSFQKLKQGFIEVEDFHNQNMDQLTEANRYLSNRRPTTTINPKLNYSNSSNTFGNMINHQNRIIKNQGSNVRMGSMVYASLSKKDENKRNLREGYAEGVRQSRSFDKLGNQKTQRTQQFDVECLNQDGRTAKYKVIKNEQDDEQMLYYCFNCAVPLVKQGFAVEELNQNDKNSIKIKMNYQPRNSKSDLKENINYFNSNEKKSIGAGRTKIGQQIKCKIILKLNKLKANKQQFNKKIQNNLENIDYFYNCLISHIEQQRLTDRQQVLRTKNLKKTEPQNYQNQLSSCLGTVDYMMKHFQGINHDYIQDAEQLLNKQVCYPKIQNTIEPKEGFQKKINEFSIFFDRTLRINLEQKHTDTEHSYKSRIRIPTEEHVSRSNSLRFSFEQALEQSRKTKISKPNTFYEMNALQEQNESQLEDSIQMVDKRQDAFRNLFPQQGEQMECSEYGGKEKHSPVFKEF